MLTSGDISKLSDRELREKLIVQPGLSNDTPRKVYEVQLLNLKLDFLYQILRVTKSQHLQLM